MRATREKFLQQSILQMSLSSNPMLGTAGCGDLAGTRKSYSMGSIEANEFPIRTNTESCETSHGRKLCNFFLEKVSPLSYFVLG